MTSQAAKNITHLVDNYRQAVEEDYSDGLGGTPSPGTLATRAALEAAIAAAIQPVERGEFERQSSAWLDFAHTTMPAFDSPEFRGAYLRLLEDAAALFSMKIKPVEPPTDAEVEVWAKEVFSLSIDGGTICAGTPSDVGTENEAFVVHRGELEAGLALMRRARATGSLERLRERVQKTIDVTPRSALLGMLLTVRDWIDEERGAGR